MNRKKHINTLVKTLLSVLIMCWMIASYVLPGYSLEKGPQDIIAKGAVLIDQDSGRVLVDDNAQQRLYPASTTKIMAALLVIEKGNLDDVVKVGEEVRNLKSDGSKAGLKPGQRISVRNLVRGLMLPSGNDAAYTLAVYVARRVKHDNQLSVQEAVNFFVRMMNSRAKELGANNTHFANPHGYHDDNHYTTPYDLAKIARQAMKYEFFREVVDTEKYSFTQSGRDSRKSKGLMVWKNTNELIDPHSRYYLPSATGIKTGHTTPAGYCLVSAASRKGINLIAVVMNSTNTGVWNDSRRLLQFGLDDYSNLQLVSKGDIVGSLLISNHGKDEPVEMKLQAGASYSGIFSTFEKERIKKKIIWNDKIVRVFPQESGAKDIGSSSGKLLKQVVKGEELGKVIYTLDNEKIIEISLLASSNIKTNGDIPLIPGVEFISRRQFIVASSVLAAIIISYFLFVRTKPKRRRRF